MAAVSRLGRGPSTSYRQAMSESARGAVRFVDELPAVLSPDTAATAATPLAPPPHHRWERWGRMGPGAEPVGADRGVSWVDGAEGLVEAFTAHLGKGLETVEETLANLALHGIVFDAEEVAWVGAADLAVAALRSTLAAAAGRNPLEERPAALIGGALPTHGGRRKVSDADRLSGCAVPLIVPHTEIVRAADAPQIE